MKTDYFKATGSGFKVDNELLPYLYGKVQITTK